MAPKYDPYGGMTRPSPKTWQEGVEHGSQDRWMDQGGATDAGYDEALAGQRGASGGAQSALERVSGFSPAATAAYNPTATMSYDPNSYYTGARRGGASAALAAMGPGGAGGAGGPGYGGAGGYSPSAQMAFSSKDVSDFDPSAAGNKFAEGAYGDFKMKLGDELEHLDNRTSLGRMKTGWFDRDRGRVVQNLGQNFNNALAQAALTFSGQRLQALQGGADLRLRAASGVDQGNLSAYQTQTESADRNRAVDISAGNDRARLTSETALAEERMGFDAASDQAHLGYQRAHDVDNLNYQRGHDVDTFNFQAGQTGLQAALERERMARGSYENAANRSAGYASANRDWASQGREAQDQRDFYAAQQAYARGIGPNGERVGGSPPETTGQKIERMRMEYGY